MPLDGERASRASECTTLTIRKVISCQIEPVLKEKPEVRCLKKYV